ncbi:UNVERIFIED_CONTAM: putative mitochondrial protein [Sesamum calycinum]|uniref:Mitochondrial protein n=1 Tax=Sesamum calycinum TaxID=2727403 RepID=A0AAW2JU75_9LAMI
MTRSNGISLVPLHLFGFPDIFIGWIEECVSTPMFSVCINGNPHGFFKGSRGLRQGDPMSPFLFVLIMEVLQLMLQQLIDQNEGFSFHWRCKEIGLFQLCFADDLLLFCKADVVSVQILRHGLDEFAKLSGLHANPQKSQLILSRHKSVWTVDLKGGSWGWRKLLRLRSALIPYIEFKIGNGESFSLWHDPWHSLGSLIRRFPRGPSRTNIPKETKLSAVLVDGEWSWPPIMDLECIEILHLLPTIHNGNDSILWRGGEFNTKVVYDIFRIPGPIVGWYPLLLGPCKIPRYSFVLWLAILEKLSTMDKPWLSHLGGVCVFCGREVETHEHLFFRCSYSRRCVRDLKATVRFSWPNRAWRMDITWATKRWKGRHIVQAAYRALLSAIVYHIWRERNQRVFQHSERPSSTIARIAVAEIRQKILSIDLPDSISTRGLYRLWRIPWPVRDTA